MSDAHVKVSGAWKALKQGGAYIKKSGAWKDVKHIWVKVSGAWKRTWSYYTVNLDGHAISSGGQCRVYINSDGTVDAWVIEVGSGTQIDAATDWIIPNAAAADEADFEAKWELTAGDAPNVFSAGWTTANTYADCTSDLYVGRADAGFSTCDVTITIRRKSDSVILATGLYEMTVT